MNDLQPKDISEELKRAIDYLVRPKYTMKELAKILKIKYPTLVRWQRGDIRDPKTPLHKQAVKKIFELERESRNDKNK